MLVLGAARDAAHVAELIARRAAVRRSPETVAGKHAT
jgi:hypothetical protein